MAGDGAAARARLDAASATIVEAVAAALPRYLTTRSARVLDAWARLSAEERARVDAALAKSAAAETAWTVAALGELFAQGAEAQRATPLEIVRGAVRGPTEVLRAAGVSPVVRDEFEERAWPDDDYGLTPHAALDLGDVDLGPALLAWGLAKSALLRARAHGG